MQANRIRCLKIRMIKKMWTIWREEIHRNELRKLRLLFKNWINKTILIKSRMNCRNLQTSFRYWISSLRLRIDLSNWAIMTRFRSLKIKYYSVWKRSLLLSNYCDQKQYLMKKFYFHKCIELKNTIFLSNLSAIELKEENIKRKVIRFWRINYSFLKSSESDADLIFRQYIRSKYFKNWILSHQRTRKIGIHMNMMILMQKFQHWRLIVITKPKMIESSLHFLNTKTKERFFRTWSQFYYYLLKSNLFGSYKAIYNCQNMYYKLWKRKTQFKQLTYYHLNDLQKAVSQFVLQKKKRLFKSKRLAVI
jgi:hypothetical protein